MHDIPVLVRAKDEEIETGLARTRAIREWLRDNGMWETRRSAVRNEIGWWWVYTIEDDTQAVHFKLTWT